VDYQTLWVYADDTVIWEQNESTLEKKFQKVITVCKDFGIKVNLDKCVAMKISRKKGGLENIKCGNHEIKEVESFKYLGSKTVTNERVKEEITERIKMQENFTN
jgi:hypothetical protein